MLEVAADLARVAPPRNETLEAAVAQNERLVADVAAWLATPPEAPTGGAPIAPALVRARMAAIDVMEGAMAYHVAAEDAEAGRDGLRDVVARSLPADLTDAQAKVMVAEKHDALTALIHQDPALGYAALAALPTADQRAALERAVLVGLLDRGVPRERVRAEMARGLAAALGARGEPVTDF